MTAAVYTPGSLVRVREREWIVQPGSSDELLRLRPLGGSDEEEVGIFTPIEPVASATFALPAAGRIGDFSACTLLRDAIRLGFRGAAGPFRSFARIAVQPRPYQLVPLLMALKHEVVRLLIADDVGIGKTVEAAMIVRELLDRGEIRRFSILCPPHLAEQWQRELRTKFHLDATLILASTAKRLERTLRHGEQLFDRYPFTIVSLDYIKAESHRYAFLNACPEMVIIDEAHACTDAGESGRASQQRYQLVRQLADNRDRNLILVTATPHSGNEDAFRSLLGLIDDGLANLPADLQGDENKAKRQLLARHVVLRRRKDIEAYLGEDTTFPERMESEQSYSLEQGYKQLFGRILAFAKASVTEDGLTRQTQRIRWWSALALLQAVASSPAAAAATLSKRAEAADAVDVAQADAIGRSVLDLVPGDDATVDIAPGGDATTDVAGPSTSTYQRSRLRELAKHAESLKGPGGDSKLAKLITLIRPLLAEGHHPIVFCRFIDTADYVAEHLRAVFPDIQVAAVTGTLPAEEREHRVAQLATHPRRILVATDCLSEGINLQSWFDAIVHYDLSWNPTRHEQREGRVDRFGQQSPCVKVITYYGLNNGIDGIVLDVLLRKHQSIRKQLGISVPVPIDTNQVVEAVLEGLILRGSDDIDHLQQIIPGLEEAVRPSRTRLEEDWKRASDNEKRSRSLFAQHAIKVDEVAIELAAVREVLGTPLDVRRFLEGVLARVGGVVGRHPQDRAHAITCDLSAVDPVIRDHLGMSDGSVTFAGAFDPQSPALQDPACHHLVRTHQSVAGLAGLVLDHAIDPDLTPIVGRCGAIKTSLVERRTTVLLVRLRYQCTTRMGGTENLQVAEECLTLAYRGTTDQPDWLAPEAVTALLSAKPEANTPPELATTQVSRVVEGWPDLATHLAAIAHVRAAALLEANRRVRDAAGARARFDVQPHLPADLLATFILLPVT